MPRSSLSREPQHHGSLPPSVDLSAQPRRKTGRRPRRHFPDQCARLRNEDRAALDALGQIIELFNPFDGNGQAEPNKQLLWEYPSIIMSVDQISILVCERTNELQLLQEIAANADPGATSRNDENYAKWRANGSYPQMWMRRCVKKVR